MSPRRRSLATRVAPAAILAALLATGGWLAAAPSASTTGSTPAAVPGDGATDRPILPVGTLGGPHHALSPVEEITFRAGRALFDRSFHKSHGLGSPEFNADSCRACHQDPVLGGAGDLDLNVFRAANDNGGAGWTQASGGNYSYNTPLRGYKGGSMTDGSIRVACAAKWPGTIPAGQVVEDPVISLDWGATFVNAAGDAPAQARNGLDGIDLMPFLTGERKEAPHEALYWRWMAQSAIREGNWKLLRGGEREYLYDLSTDIEEKDNLAARNPEIASRLRGKLSAWCAELDPPGLALGPMSPVWNDYFDHYLEGKTLPLPAAKDTSSEVAVRGWVARGGRIAEENGLIVFLPDKKGKGGFLTKNRVKLAGPVKVRLEMRAAPGQGWVSWRVEGEKDFLPENRVPFTLGESADWQVEEFELPATGSVIHLRVQAPPGEARFRTLQFKPADR